MQPGFTLALPASRTACTHTLPTTTIYRRLQELHLTCGGGVIQTDRLSAVSTDRTSICSESLTNWVGLKLE